MADPPGLAAERTSQLISTLLGDYWFDSTDHVPSAALTAVLAEFGTGVHATRAALRRSTRQGRLEGVRSGRTTAYRLAPAVRDRALATSQLVMGFGAAPVPWDGRWTCVAFSVPEAARQRRMALRKRLLRLGLGSLFDGLWITPRDAADEIDRALDELGIGDATVLRATEVPGARRVDLLSAWDIAGLRAAYAAYVESLREVGPRIEAGEVGSAEALVVRTELLVGWRSLVVGDPRIPDELLPGDWPRDEARRRFVTAYDGLGHLAEARVRQLVAPCAATPPPRHHSVAHVLDAR